MAPNPTARPGGRRTLTQGVAATRAAREEATEGLQFAILGIPLILVVFGIIQLALFGIASMQVSSAAQVGVQAARAESGSVGQGTSAAVASVRHIGIAQDISATGSRTETDATITVTAYTPSLIPFLRLPAVQASAHGPVERLTTP